MPHLEQPAPDVSDRTAPVGAWGQLVRSLDEESLDLCSRALIEVQIAERRRICWILRRNNLLTPAGIVRIDEELRATGNLPT